MRQAVHVACVFFCSACNAVIGQVHAKYGRQAMPSLIGSALVDLLINHYQHHDYHWIIIAAAAIIISILIIIIIIIIAIILLLVQHGSSS